MEGRAYENKEKICCMGFDWCDDSFISAFSDESGLCGGSGNGNRNRGDGMLGRNRYGADYLRYGKCGV